MPLPPLPKSSLSCSRPSTITSISNNNRGTDFDRQSEKYWGDILERTLSSNSLHALQRAYGAQSNRHLNGIHFTSSIDHHRNNSNLLNNNTYSDINLNKSETNLYYSNSEPRLVCEHDLHDINCAKNRAFFGAFNKIDDI